LISRYGGRNVIHVRGLMVWLMQSALLAGDDAAAATPPADQGDDSARVRVRDTAVAHFAFAGFGKSGLEEIARAAGVTTDDIVALFGNEEGLRRACDDYVLQALVGWAHEKATLEGMRQVMLSYQADPGSYQAQISYLGRAVAENTPAAARLVDVLVDESESIIRDNIRDGTMRPSDDPRALAVLIATTVLGLVTMAPHIERALGLPASQQQMLLRLALPALEIYTHGLYTNDAYLSLVRDALAEFHPPQQQGKTGPGS
jgi:TetR/AcrR family transcriptional regulator, regulator of cefoperazone and chloramphenicol sensitivity